MESRVGLGGNQRISVMAKKKPLILKMRPISQATSRWHMPAATPQMGPIRAAGPIHSLLSMAKTNAAHMSGTMATWGGRLSELVEVGVHEINTRCGSGLRKGF